MITIICNSNLVYNRLGSDYKWNWAFMVKITLITCYTESHIINHIPLHTMTQSLDEKEKRNKEALPGLTIHFSPTRNQGGLQRTPQWKHGLPQFRHCGVWWSGFKHGRQLQQNDRDVYSPCQRPVPVQHEDRSHSSWPHACCCKSG